MNSYKPRIADRLLRECLSGKGAVLVEGAKWCGKTTTALQAASSFIYMNDPNSMEQNLSLIQLDPRGFLDGEPPLLIDEWQIAPRLWDIIRFEVDQRAKMGQFILTGSSVPPSLDEIHHSGAGRFAWLRMRPMSLFESLDSCGSVSLRALFEGQASFQGRNPLDFESLAFVTCRGGWPMAVDIPDKSVALEQAYYYLDAIARSDMSRVDGVAREEGRVRRFLRAYARNQGAQATLSSLVEDMRAAEGDSFSVNTARSYLNALEGLFAIEEMPAWNPNLRSKTAIRSSSTRYFVDPSIAAASLGIGPQDLKADVRLFGFFFEALCARDLRVYADALKGSVYHYRDRSGLECDAVVHLRNGSYGLIEIKLGGTDLVEEGARNLKRLASRLDTDRMKAPSFLMVLVGVGERPYLRSDGVLVIPAGCLRD